MSTMHILDNSGDEIIAWSKDDLASVKAARKEFASKKNAGYTGYVLGRKLTKFDPDVESIIMVPPVQGGYPQSA